MKLTALIFAGVLLLAIAATAQTTTPAGTPASGAPSAAAAAVPATKPVAKNLPNEPRTLVTEDLAPGKGKSAVKGKWIKIEYTGWLYDPSAPMGRGRQIDTSIDKEPFSFKLGAGEMIKGWEDGFANMKAGGKRRLIVPSELAYGARGAGEGIVPPNSSLLYEIELIDVADSAN